MELSGHNFENVAWNINAIDRLPFIVALHLPLTKTKETVNRHLLFLSALNFNKLSHHATFSLLFSIRIRCTVWVFSRLVIWSVPILTTLAIQRIE